MSCIYEQGRKKDFEYVKKLAGVHSLINKVDVQIFKDTLPVIGKIFNFEEVKAGREGIVEVIKFREPESKDILRDIKQPELAVAKPVKGKGKPGKN
jgi:hypothetical protein